MRNFPHVWNWCKEKSTDTTDTKNNTLGESFRIWFFFYHDRLWCSGDLEVELQCHVTETNFLCAGSRLGVRHQPSIWSSKRLTSQAPQVTPGFQASSTLRSWLCTSTDAQSAGPVLVSSLRKVVIGCGPWSQIDHSRYVLVALRHGAKFRGEARLVLFLLPRCGFPDVCYSQQFSRALSQNKKSLFARTATLAVDTMYLSIYALLPADLISAGPV